MEQSVSGVVLRNVSLQVRAPEVEPERTPFARIQVLTSAEAKTEFPEFAGESSSTREGAVFPVSGASKWKLLRIPGNPRADFTGWTEGSEIPWIAREQFRRLGYAIQKKLEEIQVSSAYLEFSSAITVEEIVALLEGLFSGIYRFVRWKSQPDSSRHPLQEVNVVHPSREVRERLKTVLSREFLPVMETIFWVRDLVNEPPNYLTSVQIAEEFRKEAQRENLDVTILHKKEIEENGMAGLLAVNRGSHHPPTFTIVEYKPENPVNSRPVVFVGKGIVFDTGGMSLKPTRNVMDWMKCDMAGAATAVGTLLLAKRLNLPLHCIALAPATDNRIGPDAYLPDDVIRYADGTTVEVLNTDAEGRLILADALIWARRYQPRLVIDYATLTGSALRAVGHFATVVFSTLDDTLTQLLVQSGFQTYERVVVFPLWEEYRDLLRSSVADLKNIGGELAGAIIAAVFLHHFVRYPWIHMDIAGTAFYPEELLYYPSGGTGITLRLTIHFLRGLLDRHPEWLAGGGAAES